MKNDIEIFVRQTENIKESIAISEMEVKYSRVDVVENLHKNGFNLAEIWNPDKDRPADQDPV